MNVNPLYQQMMQMQFGMQNPMMQSGTQFQNPIQKANYILQTLRNPSAFVREQFPDVPDSIVNDPNQTLQYIQKTRNISNDQLNQILNQYPRW